LGKIGGMRKWRMEERKAEGGRGDDDGGKIGEEEKEKKARQMEEKAEMKTCKNAG
jgi:hypothetical protein